MRMRLVVPALALVMSMSACGGSDGNEENLPELDSSTSPSATPTPGEFVLPVGEKPTRPKDELSKDGAKAFSVYVMKALIYTVSTNDVDPLLGLSDGASCTTCISLAKDIGDHQDVVQIPPEPPTLSDLEVTVRAPDRYIVKQVLNGRDTKYVNQKTHEVVKVDEGTSHESLSTVLVWKDHQWRLSNYGNKVVLNK